MSPPPVILHAPCPHVLQYWEVITPAEPGKPWTEKLTPAWTVCAQDHRPSKSRKATHMHRNGKWRWLSGSGSTRLKEHRCTTGSAWNIRSNRSTTGRPATGARGRQTCSRIRQEERMDRNPYREDNLAAERLRRLDMVQRALDIAGHARLMAGAALISVPIAVIAEHLWWR